MLVLPGLWTVPRHTRAAPGVWKLDPLPPLVSCWSTGGKLLLGAGFPGSTLGCGLCEAEALSVLGTVVLRSCGYRGAVLVCE